MNGAKGLLVSLLLAVFLVGALAVQTMFFVGRNLTDADRFADAAAEVVASPKGSALIAPVVVGRIADAASAQGVTLPASASAELTRAVRAAIERPGTAKLLRPTIRRAHQRLLDHPDQGLVIGTGALRPAVVSAVESVVPGAAAAVPAEETFPAVTLSVAAPARPAVGGLSWLRDRWMLAAVVAGIAGVLALLASPRRAATATAMGVAVAALAVVPPVVHALLPPLAEMATDGRYAALSQAFVDQLTAAWGPVSLATLAIGFGFAVFGQVLFRR